MSLKVGDRVEMLQMVSCRGPNSVAGDQGTIVALLRGELFAIVMDNGAGYPHTVRTIDDHSIIFNGWMLSNKGKFRVVEPDTLLNREIRSYIRRELYE